MVGSIEEAVTKADKLAEEHLWGPFGKLQAPHTAPSLSLQNSSIACVSHAGALTGDVMFFFEECLRFAIKCNVSKNEYIYHILL